MFILGKKLQENNVENKNDSMMMKLHTMKRDKSDVLCTVGSRIALTYGEFS